MSPTNTPGVTTNFNGTLTECSIEANSGSYQSYGRVAFPVQEVNLSFSQDLAQHKRPNVPGARVESTGFNPITFRVKAPFLFGLQKGSGETWGNLYPGTFSKVVQMLTDKVAPVLTFTHPTMGQFTVKPQGGSTVTSSDIRNGQILEFELLQANEDNNNIANITTQVEFGAAVSAATIFDDQVVKLNPAPPAAITAISLENLLLKVRGAIDSTTMQINRVANIVNNAIYQVRQIKEALLRLQTAASSGLITQVNKVESGILSLVNNQWIVGGKKKSPIAAQTAAEVQTSQNVNSLNLGKIKTANGNIGIYTVTHDMTLGSVSLITHNTVDQLIKLNPSIAKTPTIHVGTQVVYQRTNTPSPSQ